MEFPERRRDDSSKEGQQQQHQSSSNINSSTCSLPCSSTSGAAEEREYMFEKVVTPSDVGKLNRLVIPKQHAERYFPLDPASNDKGGLLLSFHEGRTGRSWRFRYSYWNSSQSYVMTKGWSRFVKDKRLDAGDTVAFSRSASTGRHFIDWRRRPAPPDPPLLLRSTVVPWGWGGSLFLPPPLSSPVANGPAAAVYFRSVGPTQPVFRVEPGAGILESVPVCAAEPKKRVRLFGVNLDCSSHGGNEQQLLPPPPSPLQWSLSPTPSPSSSGTPQLPSSGMDDQENIK